MGARGRGANRTLTAVPNGDVVSIPRHKPPDHYHLTEEQKREWKTIIAALPAGHFSQENLPLLAEYVRHIITARRLAFLKNKIETGDKLDMEEYAQLCKLSEAESRTLASLATKMRLSQQAVYSARKGRPASEPKAPWETEE